MLTDYTGPSPLGFTHWNVFIGMCPLVAQVLGHWDLQTGLYKYLKKNSVDLIVTSPPFALEAPKRYGNKNKSDYLDWLESFFEGWKYVLKDTGSIVVDVGNSYEKGGPKRSLYI